MPIRDDDLDDDLDDDPEEEARADDEESVALAKLEAVLTTPDLKLRCEMLTFMTRLWRDAGGGPRRTPRRKRRDQGGSADADS